MGVREKNEAIKNRVTERMVALLDQGVAPWDRPWDASVGLPRSMSTNKLYRGINVFILGLEAMEKGYSSPYWGTYDHIAERSGGVREGRGWVFPDAAEGESRGVRKGEKGTTIVWASRIARKDRDKETGEEVTRTFYMLKTFNVFNAEQADGLAEKYHPKGTEREHTPIEECEAIVAAYRERGGPPIEFGGDRACYVPLLDRVHLPYAKDFNGDEEFYSTLFHEDTHSTGHKKRLNRDGIVNMTGHMQGELYAEEELVAELGAAMLCGIAGIEKVTEARSAAYLGNWLDVFKKDRTVFYRAAQAAQKAVDHVLGVTFEAENADNNTTDTAPVVEQAA